MEAPTQQQVEEKGAIHRTIIVKNNYFNKILVVWNFHAELIREICEIANLAKQKWLIRTETCGMRCQ